MNNFSVVSGMKNGLKKVLPNDNIGWKTPFYVEMDGQLVACRFVRWFYPFASREETYAEIKLANGNHISSAQLLMNRVYDLNAIHVYEADNEKLNGKILRFFNRYHYPIKLDVSFLSIIDWMALIMSDDYTLIDNGANIRCVMYYWDGVKACDAVIGIKNLQYSITKGLFYDEIACFDDGKKIDKLVYSTKEECEEDNTIDVVDFNDEEENAERLSICFVIRELKERLKENKEEKETILAKIAELEEKLK